MRTASLFLALTVPFAPPLVVAEGLVAPPGTLGPPGWQARIEIESTQVRPAWAPFGLGASSFRQTTRLFGDYYLDSLRLGQTGGFRLTSGVLVNQRFGSFAADSGSRSAWPYLGVGYSGGSAQGDWGFSADVGWAVQGLGSDLRLGRVHDGLGIADGLRDLRLQPMVRFGVTYSF